MPTAGQTGQATVADGRDAHDGRLGTERPPPTGDGGMGHVARRGGGGQGRAQLVQVLAPFQVDELGQGEAGAFDGLRRGARHGEKEGPIRPRDLPVLGPVDDDDADGVVGNDHGDDGQGAEPARFDRSQDVGALVLELVE